MAKYDRAWLEQFIKDKRHAAATIKADAPGIARSLESTTEGRAALANLRERVYGVSAK